MGKLQKIANYLEVKYAEVNDPVDLQPSTYDRWVRTLRKTSPQLYKFLQSALWGEEIAFDTYTKARS